MNQGFLMGKKISSTYIQQCVCMEIKLKIYLLGHRYQERNFLWAKSP